MGVLARWFAGGCYRPAKQEKPGKGDGKGARGSAERFGAVKAHPSQRKRKNGNQ